MNTDIARQKMVEQQIRTWDVSSASVLAALRELPRHRFLPDEYAHLAYSETEIPLGHGQLTMTPALEGRLLQSLALTADMSVLEIGTGSGFLTAGLARLAREVHSIDIHEDFVNEAMDKLTALGIDNVTCECMDAMSELPDRQFDAIAVCGSIPRPDSRLLERLRPGSRMFVIVGELPIMSAQLLRRGDGTQWLAQNLFETNVAPLLNAGATPSFRF